MKYVDVYIPSTYQGKIDAATHAVETVCPGTEAIPHPIKASSGINEQPLGRRQTERGARNRAANLETTFGNNVPAEGVIVSTESGVFFSLRRFGFVDRTIAYAKDLATQRDAVAISDGVRFPTRDVIQTLRKPGGFKKNTVGQSITERLGGNHQDPHLQVDRHVSRNVFLEQAATRAVSRLR